MTAVALATPSPFAVFRRPNFTWLWTGQLISTIGSSLTSIAASILVYRMTHSALSVGLMLIATALPSLVLGLVAGVLVDRYNRRHIMIASDLIRAVLSFAIPFVVPLNMGWLYVLIALSSCVTQFFAPAHASLLPETATDEELAAANSLMEISSFGSTAVGFAASGLLASAFDIKWAFYIDAVSFLASAFCIWRISMPHTAPTEDSSVSAIVRNMQGGIDFLWQTPILRSIFYMIIATYIAFGLWNTLLLPFASQALGATEFEYGMQEGVTSLSFVIGSLLMVSVANRLREGEWLTLSFIVMGILSVVYGLMVSVPLAIVVVALTGFVQAPGNIARAILVQRNTPREVRGRVNSVYMVMRNVVFIFGMAIAGLADIVGVRWMMLLAGALCLVPGLLALRLPGLGQPAAEWRRTLQLLTSGQAVPAGAGRAATQADFEFLATKQPALLGLSGRERRVMLGHATVVEATTGTQVIKRGDPGDSAYFILAGRAVAGISDPGGAYRSLETMFPGDFFGEIGALTGGKRTADVAADDALTMLRVPAAEFRQLMTNIEVSRVVHQKYYERLQRMETTALPRLAGLDQRVIRELRTEAPEGQVAGPAALAAG